MEELVLTLKKHLPSYAVPFFVRLKTHFETTATFKIKKTDLRREGFDPEQIKDPLYVLLPGADAYQPLTKEIYAGVLAGVYKM